VKGARWTRNNWASASASIEEHEKHKNSSTQQSSDDCDILMTSSEIPLLMRDERKTDCSYGINWTIDLLRVILWATQRLANKHNRNTIGNRIKLTRLTMWNKQNNNYTAAPTPIGLCGATTILEIRLAPFINRLPHFRDEHGSNLTDPTRPNQLS